MNSIMYPSRTGRPTCFVLISRVLLASTVALVVDLPCKATGPHVQTVDPTFDSVVRILYDNPGNQDPGDGYFEGTGTIVGHHNMNGVGWFCVLTADHVLSSTGQFGGALVSKPGIAFGNSSKPTSGNSPYRPAGPRVRRNGANGTSDLAVIGVRYGAFNATYDDLVRTVVPATAFFEFSDIGYGNEGRLVNFDGAGGPDGYQAQNLFGTQRYFNDKVGSFQANFSFIGYTYEAAHWFIDDPAAIGSIQGSGTTFGADSGSPYFSSDLMTDTNNDILEFFTDNVFAVHTGPAATQMYLGKQYKPYGYNNHGVALSSADVDWIRASCDVVTVPEPTAFVLLVLAIVGVVQLRRRR
jgi:hypothetical protein